MHPWQQVAVDLYSPADKSYLLVTIYYEWLEVEKSNMMSAHVFLFVQNTY